MFIFLFLIQFILWLIFIRQFILRADQPLEKIVFSAGLFLKALAGCGVGLLYTYYYHGGDTIGYFHDTRILSDIFQESPNQYFKALLGISEVKSLQYYAQNRALFFVKIASVISIFSLRNYWIMAISFSILNFIASWWFIMKLRDYLKIPDYILFFAFLCYPSVFFWSSGVLKESVALAMIYLLCGIFVRVYQGIKLKQKIHLHLLVCVPCGWILWMLKYYYAAILLPILMVILVYKLLKVHTTLLSHKCRSLLIIIPMLGIIFLTFMHLHPNLNPDFLLKAIVRNHDLSVAASEAGDYVDYQSLTPSLSSFVINFPKAVFSGLFRPLAGEGNSYLHLLSGIENLLVLGISIFAFFQIVQKKKGQLSILIVACIFYVIVLAGLIALASPNFGSLARYKVAYAPFWVFLCLLAINSFQRSNSESQSIKKM